MSDARRNDPASPDSPLADRYVLQQRLGSGGMADVYCAEDLVLRRLVAVKILKPELAADPDLAERFRIEAQAAAQMSHPNIVAVYDRGTAGTSDYIVMEYVRGETLKERIRRAGRLAPEEAARIALAVLTALEAAHGRHIVHRDITAGNVLLDEAGGVKVADFGIALVGASALTRTGTLLGTSSYLSPEQAQGQRADERSDLYSLGVVLFEMLTGRLPFGGENDVAVAVQHVSASPPDPRSFVPGLPSALVAIVAEAMQKRPDDRYQSAAEFASALLRAEPAGRDARGWVPPPYVSAGASPAAGAQPTAAWALNETPTRAAPVSAAATTRAAGLGDAATRLGGSEGEPRLAMPAGAAGSGAASPRRRRGWRGLLIVLALLVVGGVGWAVAAAVLDAGAEVPVLKGRAEDEAVTMVKREGLQPVVHREWADGAKAGDVARQRPAAGTEVEEGAKVDLWVSRGPLHVPAPNLSGKTAAAATSAIQELSLTARQRKAASETAPEGQVFRQKPAVGTEVERGATVTFWVSSGPPLIAVPDVVGLESAAAVSALQAAGFEASIDYVFGWGADPGYVVGQDPAPGTRLRGGDEVIVEVAVF